MFSLICVVSPKKYTSEDWNIKLCVVDTDMQRKLNTTPDVHLPNVRQLLNACTKLYNDAYSRAVL